MRHEFKTKLFHCIYEWDSVETLTFITLSDKIVGNDMLYNTNKIHVHSCAFLDISREIINFPGTDDYHMLPRKVQRDCTHEEYKNHLEALVCYAAYVGQDNKKRHLPEWW